MLRVLATGGFDPLHPGHLDYLQTAKGLDKETLLIVALSSDAWLMRKKGYLLMTFNERKTILEGLSCVDMVIAADDSDDTVCANIRTLKPDVFAKGRGNGNDMTPETKLCIELGIKVRYDLGDKVASSATIFRGTLPAILSSWGSTRVIYNDGQVQIRVLEIKAGVSTGLTTHAKRNELFLDLDELLRTDGAAIPVTWARANTQHHIIGRQPAGSRVVEVQFGNDIDESDFTKVDKL